MISTLLLIACINDRPAHQTFISGKRAPDSSYDTASPAIPGLDSAMDTSAPDSPRPLFGAPVVVTQNVGWGADVRTGDFNADGLPDIAVSASTSAGWYDGDRPFAIEVSLSDGKGSFSPIQVPTSLMSGYTMVMDVADLDGDGMADLVAGHSAGFTVFFSNGATLTNALDYQGLRVGPVELGDVDDDGDQDLLTLDDVGNVNLWLNDSHGAFTLAQTLPTDAMDVSDCDWDSLHLVDLDADGALDLVAVIAEASMIGVEPLAVYLGDGNGLFEATIHTAGTGTGGIADVYNLDLGDLNSDGKVELAFAGGAYAVYGITWDGGFSATTSWPIDQYAYTWVMVGDVDGDLDEDLVGTSGFELGALIQDGSFLTEHGTTYAMGIASGFFVANDGFELVDMNLDGCADVVTWGYDQGAMIIPATSTGCTGATPIAHL